MQTKPEKNYIFLSLGDSNLPPEGYTLSSSSERIEIYASNEAGLFYGIQTLIQLIRTKSFLPGRLISNGLSRQLK